LIYHLNVFSGFWKYLVFCVISGFGREVGENCALLGYYAMKGSNFLTSFRKKPIGPIFYLDLWSWNR